MSEDSMLKCLIAFVLGFLFARMMRGNGLSVGGLESGRQCFNLIDDDSDGTVDCGDDDCKNYGRTCDPGASGHAGLNCAQIQRHCSVHTWR